MSFAHLDSVFHEAVKPGPNRKLSGVVLAASGLRDGEQFIRTYGTRSIDPSSEKLEEDAVMWFASCTKLVTAVAVMQCVERGQLRLDDPAQVEELLSFYVKDVQILTGFDDTTKEPKFIPRKNPITLKLLLSHQAGFEMDFLPKTRAWRQSRGQDSMAYCGELDKAVATPLTFEPGTGWAYGPGQHMAGIMIEKVTGLKLGEYMNQYTFQPLDPNGPLASGHGPMWPLEDPRDDFGGAGLFSTAPDYLKLLQSLVKNDGKLLQPGSVDEMLKNAMVDPKPLNDIFGVPGVADAFLGETALHSQFDYSLAGIVWTGGIEKQIAPGSVTWGGLPNLKWWIDRKSGVCGIFATQLMPIDEPQHRPLLGEFQREAFARFARK